MVSVLDWSVTPGSNTTLGGEAVSNTMATAKLDDIDRIEAAGVKSMALDLAGATASGGSGNGYTFTSNGHIRALANGAEFTFKANHSCTGASTMVVTPSGESALASKAIRKFIASGEAALVTGDIIENGHYRVQYNEAANSAAGAWILLNPTARTSPNSNDGAALGASDLAFSDLFLADAGVVNWNAGEVTLTQTDGSVVLGGSATDVVLDLSGANAGQIKFPASQNASSDANTLDDYEEGTWTPAFGGTTDPDSVTYATQSGRYTKIGRLVHYTFHLQTSAVTIGSGTGALRLNGGPFTPGQAQQPVAIGYSGAFSTNNPTGGRVFNSGTGVFLSYRTAASGASGASQVSDLDTGSAKNDLIGSVTFTV